MNFRIAAKVSVDHYENVTVVLQNNYHDEIELHIVQKGIIVLPNHYLIHTECLFNYYQFHLVMCLCTQ